MLLGLIAGLFVLGAFSIASLTKKQTAELKSPQNSAQTKSFKKNSRIKSYARKITLPEISKRDHFSTIESSSTLSENSKSETKEELRKKGATENKKKIAAEKAKRKKAALKKKRLLAYKKRLAAAKKRYLASSNRDANLLDFNTTQDSEDFLPQNEDESRSHHFSPTSSSVQNEEEEALVDQAILSEKYGFCDPELSANCTKLPALQLLEASCLKTTGKKASLPEELIEESILSANYEEKILSQENAKSLEEYFLNEKLSTLKKSRENFVRCSISKTFSAQSECKIKEAIQQAENEFFKDLESIKAKQTKRELNNGDALEEVARAFSHKRTQALGYVDQKLNTAISSLKAGTNEISFPKGEDDASKLCSQESFSLQVQNDSSEQELIENLKTSENPVLCSIAKDTQSREPSSEQEPLSVFLLETNDSGSVLLRDTQSQKTYWSKEIPKCSKTWHVEELEG